MEEHCPRCRKAFQRLATHIAMSRECREYILDNQRRQTSRAQQQPPQQETTGTQAKTPNGNESSDPASLYLGVTTCPHCKKRDMKRPAAHFHYNPACRVHFTQITRATIEQSLALRQQQQEHVSEPLEWVIDMAPAVDSDLSMENNGDDEIPPPNLGFESIAHQNSRGNIVTRRTSTRSVASRGRNNKCQRIISHFCYDADDESNTSSPFPAGSSVSSMSSVPSLPRGITNHTFTEDAIFDETSMLNGNPTLEASPKDDFTEDPDHRPALGTSYHRPVNEALANLPKLSSLLSAFVELYEICRKRGVPLGMFDELVSWAEKYCNSGTFQSSRKTFPRRDSLLRTLYHLFPVPKAEGVPVSMETGNEQLAPEGYERLPRHTIVAQRWPIVSLLQEYLLDLRLFGDKRNLVNSQNPFEKYVSPNQGNDRELIAGCWYAKTYDARITDPSKQFLLVLELYLDKTGRTAGLGSYRGEPVILSSPLLNQSCRQLASAWRLLGMIEDLEISSSAKKTQQSGRIEEQGRTIRDYHKVLYTILEQLIELQRSGGTPLYVRMGDEIRYVHVIPVVSVITGDAKSGDTLCCRYLGKNCKGRVPRLCMTPFSCLEDPMMPCQLVKMSDMQTLYQGATEEDRPEKERKAYRKEMKQTSTHVVDGALYHLDFGSNELGATLATPTDMMHACESGMFPRILSVFTSTMTTSVRVTMDAITEKMFLPIRSTCNKEFLRFNFRGGATSLTMLNSHHWPGMAFTFLLAFLTDEGMEVLDSCFSKEDAELPDFDWNNAPPVDFSNVYKPPMLQLDCNDELHSELDQEDEDNEGSDGHDGSNSKLNGSQPLSLPDGNETDGEVGTDDEAVKKVPSDSEEEHVPKKKSGKKKSGNKKKKKVPKEPLKCSRRQAIDVIEEWLIFHAWYKHGRPPFTATSSDDEATFLQTCVRMMIARLMAFCPRSTGNGWKLQKLHEMLHLILSLLEYTHASNFDARQGKRLLKEFFKELARNSQQRGQAIFTEQMAKRMSEKQVIQKALASMASDIVEEHEAVDREEHQCELSPSFTLEYSPAAEGCTFRWLGANKSVQVHRVVLSYFEREWATVVGLESNALNCFTELIHKGGATFRAHPNYRGDGPWYDWAFVRFVEEETGKQEDFPCRILLFYKAEDGSTRAIVQATDCLKVESEEKRKNKIMETRLCKRWMLDSEEAQGAKNRSLPSLYSVDVDTIQNNVLVVEEEPGLCESWEGDRYIWTVSEREAQWPLLFPVSFPVSTFV